MELQDTIKERKSIRGFLEKPVPKDVLNQILAISVRAPSTKNAQPWHFYVVTGETLEQLKRANVERFRSSEDPPEEMAHTLIEPEKGTVYRDRQVDIGKRLFKIMDIGREDKAKRIEWIERGFRYFDAPAAIILVGDKSRPIEGAYLDAGLVIQTICLAAVDLGLGTCIQNQGITYADAIRDILQIPDDKRLLVAIALGYPDDDFPANKVISPREDLENVITWCGL
ncbi:nitroreductase [Desulfobacter hydrogenophilus]|uniref:Nitroreductase n=1 Tax=Desulfobacter hydrogenophilus TaxID=2291 RepID=A0A328FDH4_9BACT|nr:nitroreductase [Desulfobacter hydrogenophilus]NDY71893.1 nitroreductase [Desulfobacter hydrogenophilus]QBH11972.1 nitroreductase [Desulfobacter hydrogenophilus]RAM02668.1 nitroreductase [Desulfobacter hydrogenophilus]